MGAAPRGEDHPGTFHRPVGIVTRIRLVLPVQLDIPFHHLRIYSFLELSHRKRPIPLALALASIPAEAAPKTRRRGHDLHFRVAREVFRAVRPLSRRVLSVAHPVTLLLFAVLAVAEPRQP